jgi:hypothetical protein
MSDPDALAIFLGAGPDLSDPPRTYTVGFNHGDYEEIRFRDARWAHFPEAGEPTHLVVWTEHSAHAFDYHTVDYAYEKKPVEYEVLYGRPTNLKPMLLPEVRKLQPGDEVFVWWAKDGNYEDVRVNGVLTIKKVKPISRPEGYTVPPGVTFMLSGGGDIEVTDEDVEAMSDWNAVEWACRGWVYFYYPPEEDDAGVS